MIPLVNKTHYSLLQAYSKPKELADKCAEYGYTACGLADNNTLAGALAFQKAMRKKDIRPIIGSTIEYEGGKIVAFCQNKKGWSDLIKAVYKPITKEELLSLSSDWVVVSYTNDLDHLIPSDRLYHINDVCGAESRYVDREDFPEADMMYKVGKGTDSIFRQHLMSPSDVSQKVTDTQINNSNRLLDSIENFHLESQPLFPDFPIIDGMSNVQLLRHLCRLGWTKKIAPQMSGGYVCGVSQQIYVDRINHELSVIEGAGLNSYFLVVQDYVKWAKENSILCGPGRGSGGGCLISYLLDITNIDPMQHNLIFERFYNAGRNSPGRVSLPDIDTDFPVSRREEVINYLRAKYGEDKVAHMGTFVALKGKGALREVMRYNKVPFEQINEITKPLPDEAMISDQMENTGHTSIIEWVLEFESSMVKDYCRLEDGELVGDYAHVFRRAIKIEGTFKSLGQHASGIVLSSADLLDGCPMTTTKNGNLIANVEMGDLEALGYIKLDILGVASLDKLDMVNRILSRC